MSAVPATFKAWIRNDGMCQADIAASFDHLVGNGKHTGRYMHVERFGGFEVDDQFKLGRLQHRRLGGAGALENPRHVDADLPIGIGKIYPPKADIGRGLVGQFPTLIL
jgi:hypothetical protein